ncbi:hypothetical protein CSB09_00100 [Candidatus Gracilibacteria bacterium]|nr:MAG: hypothetical protein CSB09_00100 [Candidatus Gracilibacteria bacterium]
MIFAASFFIIFGILIFIVPEIIAYIVATVFLIIGFNLAFLAYKMRGYSKKNESSFSFGGYEIVRRKK